MLTQGAKHLCFLNRKGTQGFPRPCREKQNLCHVRRSGMISGKNRQHLTSEICKTSEVFALNQAIHFQKLPDVSFHLKLQVGFAKPNPAFRFRHEIHPQFDSGSNRLIMSSLPGFGLFFSIFFCNNINPCGFFPSRCQIRISGFDPLPHQA